MSKTILDVLNSATAKLKVADIPTARLDALVLLSDALEKDKSWILANPNFELDRKIATMLQLQIEQRALHTPLAYIRGKSEFYGREFMVTPDTLQPRAETEIMIDLLKKLTLDKPIIADIGTGSGCLAITAKLEIPESTVYATEINEAAYEIAVKNTERLLADVNYLKGNLAKPLLDAGIQPTVLLCNLPYVPTNHTINKAAMQEPKIAIFGGDDGLNYYRELFEQIDTMAVKPQYILTESLPYQQEELSDIALRYSYIETDVQDFIEVFMFTYEPENHTALNVYNADGTRISF